MSELTITSIKELNKKKLLISINYEEAFALYKGEVRRLHIKEGIVLPESVYEEIIATLTKRATLRAMSLLTSKDYARQELIDKLAKSRYPKESIKKAVAYVESYGYIDDYRYAYNYFNFKAANKSKKIIEMKLMQKGIDSNIIKEISDEFYEDNQDCELNQSIKLIRKKLKLAEDEYIENLDFKEKNKLMAYLFRKGYSMDIINKALDGLIKDY
ncbi:regulatory protein RecX [Lachnospira pectinoschiza]|uniref:Regulatory protein RecX n=1 Tax=Lachnospira pectinoschiza TaxID=28052 RepID=A0A1G9VQ34_9FIRM|nr:RecX family transcriptional regulator [Lachnospira pectinoschiza]SDM74203.1 regulatory protein [Lachnospira pectinoschiza]